MEMRLSERGTADIEQRRRDTADEARRRLVAHVAAGGTTDLGDACMAQDAAVYVDEERHRRERELVFGGWPLVAGLSQDLARPGDLLVFEEMGRSILLVRGEDGVARGYLNMCAHRGARLVETGMTGDRLRRTRISCPFHGWCYGLDGALIAAPGAEGFDRAQLAQRRLAETPVEEWNGLLLISPVGVQAGGRLAPVAEALSQLRLGQLRHVQSSSITAACNWKLAVDTYAENYHFGVLHGDSIGDGYISNVAAFDAFGSHWRIWFPESCLMNLVGRPEQEWPDQVYKTVLFLFPNTVLAVGAAGKGGTMLRTYRIFPGPTAGSTVCRMSVYSDVPADELHAGAFADESKSVVTLEDYRVAEGMQANLETAPPGFSVLYGRNEIGVQAFHAAVADALGEAGPRRV